MKLTLHILISAILIFIGSVKVQAQITSTPFTYRAISGNLPGDWTISCPENGKKEDKYILIASNKDRDQLFIFVSKCQADIYDKSKFESGLKRCLSGVQDIIVSNVEELIINQKKVYKSNIYKEGDLFRIAFGSIDNDTEYYVLLDLLNPNEANQLFQNIGINLSKIPKDACIHELKNIRIWFEADDMVKIESEECENTIRITIASLKLQSGMGIIAHDCSALGINEISPGLLKDFLESLLESNSDEKNIYYEGIFESKFKGRFCYTALGFLDGILYQKVIMMNIGMTIYYIITVNTYNINIANETLSRIFLVE